MDMRPGVPDPRAVEGVARLLKRERPRGDTGLDVHSHMSRPGLDVLTKAPVVWGTNHTATDARTTSVYTHERSPHCGAGCIDSPADHLLIRVGVTLHAEHGLGGSWR